MPIKNYLCSFWVIPILNYDQKIPKDFKVVNWLCILYSVKLEISFMNVLSNGLSNTIIIEKCSKSLIFIFSIFAKVGHIFKINHFKAMNSVHGLSKNTLTLSITCWQKLMWKVCKRVCCARHKPQGVIQLLRGQEEGERESEESPRLVIWQRVGIM